jgi:hypothetical protein
MAGAFRGLHELPVNDNSALAEGALALPRCRGTPSRELHADGRRRLRLQHLRPNPITDTLYEWLTLHRQRATEGTATAKAID